MAITAGRREGWSMEVDTVLLQARMKNMDADMGEFSAVFREAVKPIFASYKLIAPSQSGEFKRDIYKQVSRSRGGFGAVGLLNTGRSRDRDSHSGVVEFGGTIPVPHSRENPALRGKRRMASRNKPWIGGRDGTSYYLYPVWDTRWEEVVPPFVEHMKDLCRKYMPS